MVKVENKALKIENAELRERLGLNSKSSLMPSSKELYKIKKLSQRTIEKLSPKLDMKVIAELKWM